MAGIARGDVLVTAGTPGVADITDVTAGTPGVADITDVRIDVPVGTDVGPTWVGRFLR
jgi:hypothetical protein